ncbi:hypothetical protein, partial [Pandoraea pneumonica]|uniref:hypothetical protein n=1 Tax=Pandoraea pneumonica TaxID=2508299 RepID=UPI003CE6886A
TFEAVAVGLEAALDADEALVAATDLKADVVDDTDVEAEDEDAAGEEEEADADDLMKDVEGDDDEFDFMKDGALDVADEAEAEEEDPDAE